MVYGVRFIYHPITLTVTAISPNHIRPRRVNTFGKTFRGAAGLGGSPACDGIGIPKLAVAHSDLVAFEVCPQTRSLHTVYRRDALCCHVYAPV